MHNSAILLVSAQIAKDRRHNRRFHFRHNGNILSNDEHGDEESNLFLTRIEFDRRISIQSL